VSTPDWRARGRRVSETTRILRKASGKLLGRSSFPGSTNVLHQGPTERARFSAAIVVIQAVNQVQIAGSTTPCAYTQFSSQCAFHSGCGRRGRLVPYTNLFDPVPPAHGIVDAI
jgi:hypothetical protein